MLDFRKIIVKIKKGDTVKILSGKDKGKVGKVLSIDTKNSKIVVEKVNVVKKHKKQTQDQKDPGGIIEIESPISASKAMIVCASCNKAARVGFSLSKGKKVRICKRCKKAI